MTERHRGRVKFYATHKGFGFIVDDADGKEYFCHRNDMGGILLGRDDLVEFGLQDHQRGPCAVHIQRVIEDRPRNGFENDDECPRYIHKDQEAIGLPARSS